MFFTEKLDPPNITSCSFRWLSEDCILEIQWKKPESSPKDFIYEIKINDDVSNNQNCYML